MDKDFRMFPLHHGEEFPHVVCIGGEIIVAVFLVSMIKSRKEPTSLSRSMSSIATSVLFLKSEVIEIESGLTSIEQAK
jgi:hypothetical protein